MVLWRPSSVQGMALCPVVGGSRSTFASKSKSLRYVRPGTCLSSTLKSVRMSTWTGMADSPIPIRAKYDSAWPMMGDPCLSQWW
eukprot:5935529-Ditylum_brightwellii.AAC.1